MTTTPATAAKGQARPWLGFGLLITLGLAAFMTPERVAAVKGGPINSGDTAWMLASAALVLLMTPGLAYFYGGMVSRKNVVSTMLQSFVCMGVVSLLWVTVGFSLAFGDSIGGIIGNPFTFFLFQGVGGATHPDLSPTIPFVLFALFQAKFAIITPALITGSFAERVKFSTYLVFICLFTLFVYCPLAHWTWHPQGFLRVWGVLDFAGGTVVHMSAGLAALAGALVLGPRAPKKEAAMPANIPYVLLGTGMLWFGWFGFNGGSALAANETAALAFATTHMASAAAMVAWIFMDVMRGRKASALGACIGAVVGLVAITPAAGFVTIGHSLIIGMAASMISNLAVGWRTSFTRIDDTLDVFPCHGVGGMVGMVLTAVFAKDVGLIHGQTKTFQAHMLALAIVTAYAFAASWILYKLAGAVGPMRVSGEEERKGLDLTQHGEAAEAAVA